MKMAQVLYPYDWQIYHTYDFFYFLFSFCKHYKCSRKNVSHRCQNLLTSTLNPFNELGFDRLNNAHSFILTDEVNLLLNNFDSLLEIQQSMSCFKP